MKDIFQNFFDYKLNFNMTNEEFEKVKNLYIKYQSFCLILSKNVFPNILNKIILQKILLKSKI